MGVEVGEKVDIGGHLPHHLLLSNLLGPWKRQRGWGGGTCLPTVRQQGQWMGSIPEESTRWRCCPSLGAPSCPGYCRFLTRPVVSPSSGSTGEMQMPGPGNADAAILSRGQGVCFVRSSRRWLLNHITLDSQALIRCSHRCTPKRDGVGGPGQTALSSVRR